MRSYTINPDGSGNSADSDLINRGLNRQTELQFYDSQTIRVEQTTRGTRFHVKRIFSGGISGGGFQGEYDPTKAYAAGDTFLVSSAQTIAGINVIAGYYGVPPATNADVLGNPWAGFVPANPTGNAVPQSPLPSLGAAPNNVFYAKLILAGC